jgi:hypothetical protein
VSKAPPPLLGFNNNVRHRGRIFHIQTEDSGVRFPRIVTHLFADGGRIVKTARTDYTEHLEKSDMSAVVRGMMKEQHKAMFAALRAGEMDPLLESVCGPLDALRSKAPPSQADPTSQPDLATARVLVGPSHTPVAAKPPEPAAATTPAPAPTPTPRSPSSDSLLSQPGPVADAQAVIESMQSLRDAEGRPPQRSISNPNLRKPTPSVTPPPSGAFDFDVASLDDNPPKTSQTPALPPLRPPHKSSPSARPPIPARPVAAAATEAAPAVPVGAAATGTADLGPSSLGRPQTRLAAAPPVNARSIFGDGAISEQSLDEVILSYLAEDLEEPK